ncbi:MAG: hypothetical protein MI741_14790 [Rhodospirillales bacterium]|nr:hypothetical protein [Rhodospirillales bacterium]
MDVEAFTLAKDPKNPDRNEDRYVIVPGRAYAVIDGVSDKTGLRFKGQAGGQLAGRMVEDVIRQVCEDRKPEEIEADWLTSRLEERFQATLEEIMGSREIDVPPNIRFGAQLVLALEGRSFFRFIIIGDSGLRINGREVFLSHHPLDDICSAIRKAVWHCLDAQAVATPEKNEIARAYTVSGLGSALPKWSNLINEDMLFGLREAAFVDVRRSQESLEELVVRKALLGGLREQNLYINRVHPLGYPCINGFPIPREFIVQFDRGIEDIETIELFSDGYFGCPDGTRISDWEARLANIEATDPEKVRDFASTKGSYNGRFSDDRTVMILRRRTQA